MKGKKNRATRINKPRTHTPHEYHCTYRYVRVCVCSHTDIYYVYWIIIYDYYNYFYYYTCVRLREIQTRVCVCARACNYVCSSRERVKHNIVSSASIDNYTADLHGSLLITFDPAAAAAVTAVVATANAHESYAFYTFFRASTSSPESER